MPSRSVVMVALKEPPVLVEPKLLSDLKRLLDDLPRDQPTLPYYIFYNGQLITPKPTQEPLDFRTNENNHRFITIAKQRQAIIIECFFSEEVSSSFIESQTTITLDSHATLHHCILQQAISNSTLRSQTHIHQKNNSVYQGTTLLIGGLLNQCLLNLHLEETHAQANIYGLQIGKDCEKIEHALSMNHQSPHCQTHVKTRGVAHDRSTLSFQGTIIVQKEAFNCDAALENKNLLLSDKATLHTQPQLDIHQADVRCTHGATVGHLDLEALFYLQSRGIAAQEAKVLLIDAFIHPMLEGLSKPLALFVRGLIHGS